MTAQVAGDVLQDLQSDQHSQQIAEHLDQVIAEPGGFRARQKLGTERHHQLNQRSKDDHPSDQGEQSSDFPFCGIDDGQKGRLRLAGAAHG